MSSLKISEPMSGVPIPPARRGPAGELAKALLELGVGQCRDIRDGYTAPDNIMKQVSRYNGRWDGRRFQCRKENDAVRVWRVQ